MENGGFEMNSVSLENTPKLHAKGTSKNVVQNKIKVLPFDESNHYKTNSIVEVQHEVLEYDGASNYVARGIQNTRNAIVNYGAQNNKCLKNIFSVMIFILYNVYLCGAIYHSWDYGIEVDWCDGLGMLIILTAIVYWSFFYYLVLKKCWGRRIQRLFAPIASLITKIWSKRLVPVMFFILSLIGVIVFLIIDSTGDERRLVSITGVCVILSLLFFISKHPGRVVWRQVMSGLALQFFMALAMLRWEGGRNAMNCISAKITTFLDFGLAGSSFIYNYLSSGKANVTLTWDPTETSSSPITSDALIVLPPVLVFRYITVIYFVGFFVSLLYHLGAMTWIVSKLGWFLQIIVGTTAAESMSAAGNIFLGLAEAPLLIQPYLPEMTCSELHAIMTGGFATIAGGAMAAYISFGIDAGYLLSASVMAAPAALGLSKLVYPETKVSRTTADDIKNFKTKTNGNALDAAAQGATQGIILIAGIVANLIAFISFVKFFNALISWFGMLVGVNYLSFEWMLGKLFIPLAWVMGIQWSECEDVALLLGLKVVVNEFVAYERLATRMTHLSNRSKVIVTYAMCSFANLTSIGIQLGSLGGLIPNRRKHLVNTIWRAFITGVAAGLMNGCVAGMLISSGE